MRGVNTLGTYPLPLSFKNLVSKKYRKKWLVSGYTLAKNYKVTLK